VARRFSRSSGAGRSVGWDTYLKALYGFNSDRRPWFGKDAAFYVFTLPLLEDLRDLFLVILFLAGAAAAAVYWARGAVDFGITARIPLRPPPLLDPARFLLCATFIQLLALTLCLLLHTNGVVFGLRYVTICCGSRHCGSCSAFDRRRDNLSRQRQRARIRLPVIAFVAVSRRRFCSASYNP